ncbi:MAG: LptF/LptG family permease, partial [Pseudomonadota bacterium]
MGHDIFSVMVIKLLDKMIAWRILRLCFGVTCGLSICVVMIRSLRLLDLLSNAGAALSTVLGLIAMLIPPLFTIILPIGFVIAVISTYRNLAHNGEQWVFQAAGMSPMQMAKPVFMVGGMILIILLGMRLIINPWVEGRFYDNRFSLASNFATSLIKAGEFVAIADNITIYVGSLSDGQHMKNIFIHDTRDVNRISITTAQSGQILETDDGPYMVVHNGSQVIHSGDTIHSIDFASYNFPAHIDTSAHDERWRKPNLRTSFELLDPDLANSVTAKQFLEMRTELVHRLFWPLSAPALALLCCLIMLR